MKKQHLFVSILILSFFSLFPGFAQVISPEINYSEERASFIKTISERYNIRDRKLLYSIELIDRELFVPEKFKKYAYAETSIPLSNGKTIPSITEIVKILNFSGMKGKQKVLIMGNNAGYAAALFSYFYDSVYLIETDRTRENLYKTLLNDKYNNITVYYGNAPDSFQGYGPFDSIILLGAVGSVEPAFFDVLKSLGEIIFPMESRGGLQQIIKYRKAYSEISITAGDVSFFPSLF